MAEAEIVARRYGQALYELAEEKGSLDTVAADAAELRRAWTQSEELREVMARPEIAPEEKKAIWKDLLADSADPDLRSLLYLLTDKNRLNFLTEILDFFERLLRQRSGEVMASVCTAQPLRAEQEEELKQSLSRMLDKKVTLQVTVDEALLGGLVVRVEDRMFDGSLRSRLTGLTERMQKMSLNEGWNTEEEA